MTLTQCQNNAISSIEAFLLSDEPALVLSGPAGVGKSYTIDKVTKRLNTAHSDLARILGTTPLDTFHLTATTNKAASIINGSTVDSLLSLRTVSDFKTGKTKRIATTNSLPHLKNSLIVIDEGSMVDDTLKGYIDSLLPDSKIIYSLDNAQLYPVGLNHSPVLDAGYPVVPMITPCRQDIGSELYAECNLLREAVLTNTTRVPQVNSQIRQIGDDEAIEFFTNKTDEDKILCHTNDLAVRLNEVCRGYKGIHGHWKPGEIVTSNGLVKDITGNILLRNEKSYVVTSVEPDTSEAFPTLKVLLSGVGAVIVPQDGEQYKAAIKKASSAKDWKEYFRLKEHFADLRGGHTSTIYKAQGSSYNRVMVNLADLNKVGRYNKDLLRRLIYVAVSRARHEVLLYGSIT